MKTGIPNRTFRSLYAILQIKEEETNVLRGRVEIDKIEKEKPARTHNSRNPGANSLTDLSRSHEGLRLKVESLSGLTQLRPLETLLLRHLLVSLRPKLAI